MTEIQGTPEVFIIEDSRLIAAALEEYLVEAGFRPVASVSSYSEALDRLLKIEPDACILDLQLKDARESGFGPGEEGRRLLSILNTRKIPTVIYSGHISSQYNIESLHQTLRTVDKASSMDKVIEALIGLLEERQ